MYVSASGTETGTGVGRTPEEVNEWRKAVSQRTSTSLHQRRPRVASAQPGNGSDAPRNTFNNADNVTANVWSGNSAVSGLSHVLDEVRYSFPPYPPELTSFTSQTIPSRISPSSLLHLTLDQQPCHLQPYPDPTPHHFQATNLTNVHCTRTNNPSPMTSTLTTLPCQPSPTLTSPSLLPPRWA